MSRAGLLALTALLAPLVAGCVAPPPPVASDSVARIDDDALPYRAFALHLTRTAGGGAGDPETPTTITLDDEALSALFDQFIDQQLLIRLARTEGFAPGDASFADDAVSQRAVAFLLARDAEPVQVDDAEVAARYEATRDLRTRGAEVSLRSLLVSERAQAEAALAEIDSGTPFADVAAGFSEDPNADRGGDQGRLAQQDLPPAFSDVIFALAPGERSEIIETDYGFHIFLVTARHAPSVTPFEDAAPAIRRELERGARAQRVTQLIDEARTRHPVHVFPDNLPFTYQGIYRHDDAQRDAARRPPAPPDPIREDAA
ncbi:MAG: peptidyl-prolyl cis-trans isomerase [Acidobacteriota bacterium]